MSDITDDVLAIIKRHSQVDRAKLELDDKLQDLGIESIDAVTIIFYLEEKFDIEIPLSLDNSELDFLTVGDVLKAVNTLTRKAQ